MALINNILSIFTQKRLSEIEYFKNNPFEVQRKTLIDLLQNAANTEYGEKYDFSSISSEAEFSQKVPCIDYNDLQGYIEKSMHGEDNLLWNEKIKWYAKSSGTTNARSKFIPVSQTSLEKCHFQGAKDVLTIFNNNYPDSKVFLGKTLGLGGSSEINTNDSDSRFGDLSAILISNTPFWANLIKVPSASIMLMDNWDLKIDKIIETTLKKDVRTLAGVPSWFLTLINKILEKTGKKDLTEVWPNLELFVHGGISFDPYREQYKKLIPNSNMKYMETYNASEGFFGIQDDPNNTSLLLMLDYGIYYEFIPDTEIGKKNPSTIGLKDVKKGVNYAMVISTNGGLWRYIIGDTIKFTSTFPYKFVITGRTKLFINAFGEELIIDNAMKALDLTCRATNSKVFEFTAAPIFMNNGKKGAHEWIIEFIEKPKDIGKFAELLDKNLRKINSDYDAKRLLSLKNLKLHIAKTNLFNDWLKSNGKLGGQNKVPRLWNDRTHISQLLEMNKD